MPKIIPFKDTLLCNRRKVNTTLKDGKTKGGIVLPEKVQESTTNIADVVEVAELTFADQHILDNAEKIVESLGKKAANGDCEALKSLFEVNDFVKRKSIRVGDTIFLAKYAGVDFYTTGIEEQQTIIRLEDITGIVISEENE